SGETELVNKEKTDISVNITPRDVHDLHLNVRDLANLAYLAPGAKPVDSYDPTKNRIAIVGINGSSGRNLNVTVNGIDNKDNTVGGPVMQFPLEAIQEFVISTQRFSAVNGRSEGAAVNVVTKSGSKSFHGSAFFFLRDKKLNARAVNNFPTGTKETMKAPFNRKQFGSSKLLAIKGSLRSFLGAGREIVHGACVQLLVAQKEESRPVKTFAPRLSHHINRRSFTAPVDGGKPLSANYKFLNCFKRELHYRPAHRVVLVV